MKAIITADLHWGAKSPSVLLEELNETLMKDLENMSELDAFIIAGDIFDSRQWLSSDVVDVAMEWFFRLQDLVYTKLNGFIVLIKGTRNHDGDQLKLVYKILQDRIPNSIYLCDSVREIGVVSNDDEETTDILCIPEEYISDQDLYYKDYFNKKYDLVIGHGMIDKIWYAKDDKDKYGSTSILSAPVFELDKLLDIGKYVYFGHVHVHKRYKERFQYIGPISSWDFGNTHAGYIYLDYCPDTKSIREEKYIKNTKAPKFQTKSISIQEEISLEDFNNKIYEMVEQAHLENVSKLKIVVNLYPNVPNFKVLKDYINNMIGTTDFLTISLNTDIVVDNEKISTSSNNVENIKPIVTDDDLVPAIKDFISRKLNKDRDEETTRKDIGDD